VCALSFFTPCRAYVFPGVGTSPGSVGSNITLIKPDSVASNNVAPAPVSFLYTCAGYVCPTGAPAKSPVSNTLAVPPTDGVCCCLATAAVYTDFSTRIRTNAQMTLKQVSATASTTRVTWGYFRHIYANKCSPTSNALLCQKSTYPVPPLTGTRGSYENGYCLDSVVPIFSNSEYSLFRLLQRLARTRCVCLPPTTLTPWRVLPTALVCTCSQPTTLSRCFPRLTTRRP
jgi:hypothetical protein